MGKNELIYNLKEHFRNGTCKLPASYKKAKNRTLKAQNDTKCSKKQVNMVQIRVEILEYPGAVTIKGDGSIFHKGGEVCQQFQTFYLFLP